MIRDPDYPAEGVETEKQLEFLRYQECGEIQGFFTSRPLPAEEVERFLAEGLKFC